MTRWVLDEIVDAFEARVVVERDAEGAVRSARFDLAGLPRMDSLLVGRPVGGVPALVERLCGLCPAAHHLAGVRALEALSGSRALTPAAEAVRRLLHHGSGLAAHAPRLLAVDPRGAALLGAFGRDAVVAAGSPGHFPVTAVPGGVRAAVSPGAAAALAQGAGQALDAARRIARAALAASGPPPGAVAFGGADAALVDEAGRPDLLGARLRVVAADGGVIEHAAPPARWDEVVAEAEPGAAAPRPYLVALGRERGAYRVGPVAQLRVGELTTPVAAQLQAEWRACGGGSAGARAVLAVHSVEVVGRLLDERAWSDGPLILPAAPAPSAARVRVGWVDGPRGLLVHRYATDAAGIVTGATILTPTAQNERWLAELLRSAAGPGPQDVRTDAMEDAIREADPCLPCASAPAGAMGLRVETVTAAPDGGA